MILVLRVCSVRLSRRPRPLWEHHTTYLLKLSNPNLIVSSQIYGHLVCYCMKCAHFSHLSTRKVYISLQGKLLWVNTMTCLVTLVRMLPTYFKECFAWIQRSDQISTPSLDTLWLLSVSRSFWLKMISEMSFRIQFFTTKMYLMNSKQFRLPRRRKMKENKSLQLKKLNVPSKEWLSWNWTSINQSMDKIKSFSMKCLWTISITCTNQMRQQVSQRLQHILPPFQRDPSLNKRQ